MARFVRAIVVSVICVVTVSSLQGCGATHAMLGIREAPKASSASAPLTVDQARRILTRAFTAADQGEVKTGKAAGAALRRAYTGEALRGAVARAKLASIQPAPAISPLLVSHPKLLSLSRGFAFPRFIVAQTVAAEGSPPILHLLTSPDAATPYRISTSVEMIPPTTVQPFDSLGNGSPLVPKTAVRGTGLVVAPATLLEQYCARLAFPAKAVAKPVKSQRPPPFAADAFADQVRVTAAGFAKAVATQATFTQVHKVLPSSVYAVRQASGDALVFGVLERTDNVAVKSGQRVKTDANKAYVLLSGKKVVTSKAISTTLEFVVFAVPRSSGKATLVAAREQLVAGSGS